jgi:hypothetical protein
MPKAGNQSVVRDGDPPSQYLTNVLVYDATAWRIKTLSMPLGKSRHGLGSEPSGYTAGRGCGYTLDNRSPSYRGLTPSVDGKSKVSRRCATEPGPRS